ncbi:hypothetical protein AGMMS50268_13170 [Spirochaetia bacterium]|nr:hypothetical protein AGMMS50268_13170 [Spirochaetia bacterium]
MVYLAKKDGGVVHHTSLRALKALDGIEAPDLEVSDEEFEAAGNIARLVDGEIVLGKTEAEKAKEDAGIEIQRIKVEIASRDYRALKAQKLNKPLDTLYPGESAWYKEQLDRMDELEAVIADEGN